MMVALLAAVTAVAAPSAPRTFKHTDAPEKVRSYASAEACRGDLAARHATMTRERKPDEQDVALTPLSPAGDAFTVTLVQRSRLNIVTLDMLMRCENADLFVVRTFTWPMPRLGEPAPR